MLMWGRGIAFIQSQQYTIYTPQRYTNIINIIIEGFKNHKDGKKISYFI